MHTHPPAPHHLELPTHCSRHVRHARRLLLALGLLVLVVGCDSGEDAAEPEWQVILEQLEGALFSVTGTASDDVWVVGADRGDGLGPTVLHWNGDAWTYMDTGLDAGDLLWVHVFDDGTLFTSGSDGRILRRRDGAFEEMSTPGNQFVWGVWGAAPDDMWAVGGQANGGTGFVWRNQGAGWEAVDLGPDAPSPNAWFKVWGTAGDDVWFCGLNGALLHWDGALFEVVDSGTTRNLLTVNGRADGSLVTAVGGAFGATLVASRDGGPWQDVTPTGDVPLQTFGVHHRGDTAWAVGIEGVTLRHDGERWTEVPHEIDMQEGLHAVWIDPDGGVWAVGGLLVAPPFRNGTLLYRGHSPPSRTIEGP